MRRVAVDGFWMDEHPVTVEAFARFVDETGSWTVAERPLDPADYPAPIPRCSRRGRWCSASLPAGGPARHPPVVDYVVGASWRHPRG